MLAEIADRLQKLSLPGLRCSNKPRRVAPAWQVAAAAGHYHTVLLRDDGEAIAFGRAVDGQCSVPERPRGTFAGILPNGTYGTNSPLLR